MTRSLRRDRFGSVDHIRQRLTAPLLIVLAIANAASAVAPCRILVVDQENGWPVPLVELRTTHNSRFVTDNAGVIALDDPELLGREIWFSIHGHGYQVPRDGFGNAGVRLTPQAGESLRVEVDRTIIARRIGRLTGTGLFAESQKLGDEQAWRESPVFGCDSVQLAVHRDRCYWLWGDTSLAFYPLGIFHSTSATTTGRSFDFVKPPVRPRYEYFVDEKGVPRGVAKMPGDGPTWLTGYVSLPDRLGDERLVATYRKIKPPLEAYEIGLCVWDDAAEKFELLKKLWTKSEADSRPPPCPDGHAAFWTDNAGSEWLLFGNPFPTLRCPPTFEAWQDRTTWEVLEPQRELSAAASHDDIQPHSGSIAWNAYRRRWVTVFMQRFGKPSAFGELWYAEAESPTGPWGPAVKILSHDNYTFYNPRLHAEFTDAQSPILLFEGTYTAEFADRPVPTPRYNYNQILYRLDLDDPALASAHIAD